MKKVPWFVFTTLIIVMMAWVLVQTYTYGPVVFFIAGGVVILILGLAIMFLPRDWMETAKKPPVLKYLSVKEMFSEERRSLNAFLNLDDPFWIGVRDNTISNEMLYQTFREKFQNGDTHPSAKLEASMFLAFGRLQKWVSDPG